jgi:hypothetical protein
MFDEEAAVVYSPHDDGVVGESVLSVWMWDVREEDKSREGTVSDGALDGR